MQLPTKSDMPMTSSEKTYLQNHFNDSILTAIFIQISMIKIINQINETEELKSQIQEESSNVKTKFQKFREKAAFVGYVLLGLAGLRSNFLPQHEKIGTMSPQAIMRFYEQEMDSQEISTKQLDAEQIIIVDGIIVEKVKDDTTNHSKTDSSLTVKIQAAQLGEDNEDNKKLNPSSTDGKKLTATPKGNSNKKRRASRKYGKIMRLSDLPPLKERWDERFDYDESLLEEGNHLTYRPSKQKIGIRLPYFNVIIRN